MKNDDKTCDVLGSLTNYFEEKVPKIASTFTHPKITHYYNEIIRFKSKLNFIINKTFRSLKRPIHISIPDKARHFYATYRVFWESASIDEVIMELKVLDDDALFLSFLKQLYSFSWKKALEGKSEIEKLSLEEALPTFFIKHLLPVMSLESIRKNAIKMNDFNKTSDCTMRYNTLIEIERNKVGFENVEHYLSKNGINYKKDGDFPELIHVPLHQKDIIIKSPFYKEGSLIFQDKASAVVVHLLDPKPGDFILDMCASPGMKTSLIAQYSHNKALIIAGEFLFYRAIESKKLLKHLNVSYCNIVNADGIQFPIRFNKRFDKILLDAPCTGSGTFLSNPELKWRQNKAFMYQNMILQEKMLDNALELLKTSGTLVYSVCSLYPEEGELQVQKIINRVEAFELPEWLSPGYSINETRLLGTARLFPSLHGTQGFFMSKLRKI